MQTFDDPLGSVRGITVLWACSVVGLAWLIDAAARRARRNLGRLRDLSGEDGFAYSLGFLLTMPFLMVVVALVVETTLLLASKAGTFYAAYAAARSAIVWDTAQPPGVGDERIRLAAVHAIAPFASSNPAHLSGDLEDSASGSAISDYVSQYHAYCPDGPLGDGYLARKLLYAQQATSLARQAPANWGAETTVKVTHEHPFTIGIVGRALGHAAPWGGCYTYTIETSVTLQNEGPKNDSQGLGIRYESDH